MALLAIGDSEATYSLASPPNISGLDEAVLRVVAISDWFTVPTDIISNRWQRRMPLAVHCKLVRNEKYQQDNTSIIQNRKRNAAIGVTLQIFTSRQFKAR